MKCNIADLIVDVTPDDTTLKQIGQYLITDDAQPEICVAPKTMVEYAKGTMINPFQAYQYLSLGNNFYRALLDYNGMMLHSSAVVVNDKAYLFSAASGTGKSTHTKKWLELFGINAYILNDDKPAIRILEDGIYAYGTPWSGKHDISVNKKVKLQGICFLERAEKNWIKRMDVQSAFIRIYHGTLHNLTPQQLDKMIDIINTIIAVIPVYQMGCTPTIEAAQMAYETMSKPSI